MPASLTSPASRASEPKRNLSDKKKYRKVHGESPAEKRERKKKKSRRRSPGMLHLSGIPGIRGGIIRRVGNSNSAAFQRRLVTPCRPEPTARPPFWKRSTRRRQFSGANSWNTSQPIGYWNLPDCLPNLSCLPPKINNNKRPWSFPCSKVFHRPIKNLEHLPKRLAWLRLAWFRLA